jgi:hypothetical protein
MHLKTLLRMILLMGCFLKVFSQPPHVAFGQDFVNLDFEAADVSAYGSGPAFVPITNAMPGWQEGYAGGSQLGFGFVIYNTVSLGSAEISLQGPGSSYQPFQGNYFVLLQPNYPSGQVIPAIAQVGTVPNSAQSLRFFAFGSLSVSFANQQIPLSVLDSTPQYTVYGGDISAFAGQTGELRFEGGAFLDNIFFSPQPIPEPSGFGLVACGALLLGWRLYGRSKM